MNRATLLPSATVAALALAFSACGGDDSSSSSSASEEAASSQSTALREAGETRDALQAALATYKQGDKAAAEEQVSEAYLQHFEEVEGALDKADHELNEKLEDAIREELRADIKAGKPAAEVEQSIDAITTDLDRAEALLR
jgi:DNA phosphorothioation-dependent restriction protein DptG